MTMVTAAASYGHPQVGNGVNRRPRNIRFTGSPNPADVGCGETSTSGFPSKKTFLSCTLIGMKRTPTLAGPGADCPPRLNGNSRHLASPLLAREEFPRASGGFPG